MPKSLIIVESPAKARTLKRYLGKNFEVKASVGHIRDLPVSKLGVDVDHDFAPQYVTIKGKAKIIADLKNSAKRADEIFLAPDPDREGEAIAWHIAHCLKSLGKPMHRVLFYELTKKAILAAVENAVAINQDRFAAQQARRILDRLMGYQISPLLWDKVRRGLSAGRVQSVALRMICEREEAVKAFEPEEYWTIDVNLQKDKPPSFIARLDRQAGKKIAVGNQEEADRITGELTQAVYRVRKVERKKRRRRPTPPFITSTLQQDAHRKLRFSAKKTMAVAQSLYEGINLGAEGPTGLITYMRTDSVRVNDDALAAARAFILEEYGKEYLPAKAVLYKTSKAAQDAHEAIRPTDIRLTPDHLAKHLSREQISLYALIWKRFAASQMSPAIYDQTTVLIDADKYGLKATGSIMRFLGFMKLYVESVDDAEAGGGNKAGANGAVSGKDDDVELPDLVDGDRLQQSAVLPKQHFTQPPPRYNEASLVKALEENGVGRPSTYAAIISTIIEKEYVLRQQGKFSPTDLGELVNTLLVAHFSEVINVEFTAAMEGKLDKVEAGRVDWLKIIKDFYGPFSVTLEQARKEMKSVKKQAIPTDVKCELCGGVMVIKWGRMGQFLACENYPECKHTQNFKNGEDGSVIPVEREKPEESGETCEKCGKPMVYKFGRYGKFLACSGYPKCRHIRAETTGVKCPTEGCSGEIVRKISKRGKVFYSCNKYPACKFALWDKPVQTACPQCKAPFMLEKQTKKMGPHLKCADKACGCTVPLPEKTE